MLFLSLLNEAFAIGVEDVCNFYFICRSMNIGNVLSGAHSADLDLSLIVYKLSEWLLMKC